MDEKIKSYFNRHIELFRLVEQQMVEDINQAATILIEALRSGRKILVMGNGGSAADAQHFSAELVGRYLKDRGAIAAIALSTDTSILTAVGNDFGFDEIFSRQVEALAGKEDVLFCISTSGNSQNIINAVKTGKKIGCRTFGLLGKDGGKLAMDVDHALIIQNSETPLVQDVHGAIIHILCGLIEDSMRGK
ncbi:MAG: phosphoheptose isomerase [Desulfuromonas sp.]|nr:MAG: phosphoheptose isomerase [Desulfuromonas sp.]